MLSKAFAVQAALIMVLLSACATTTSTQTLTELQNKCDLENADFPSYFQCTKASIQDGSPLLGDPSVKLYLLNGERLAGFVTGGKLSSLDAKLEWQKQFIEIANRDALAEEEKNERVRAAFRAYGQTEAVKPIEPTYTPVPTSLRRQTKCTSNSVLGTVYTNCNEQ